MQPHRRRSRAFTLVELLVIVAVIGILTVLLLPAVMAAREAARRASCKSNLRQVGVALHQFHEVRGSFPVGCEDRFGLRHSWITHLLPFFEQQAAWEAYDWRKKSRGKKNQPATKVVLHVLLCPSTASYTWERHGASTGDKNRNGSYDFGDGMAYTDYGGVFGDGRPGRAPLSGVFVWDEAYSLRHLRDGSGNTIAVAEDTGRGWVSDAEWANGENIFDVTARPNSLQQDEMWSDHPGGVQVLLADGSVQFVSETIDMETLTAFCTRDGSEVVSLASLGK